MLPEDPILDEIRRVRHRISAQFDHDPFKLVEYYMKLQEATQDRFLGTAKVINLTERSPSGSLGANAVESECR